MRSTIKMGGLLATSLALTLGAAAQPASAAAQSLTQGYIVRNASSHQIRLAQVQGEDSYEGRPDIGTRLSPGSGVADHELVYHFARNTHSVLLYDVLGDAGETIGTVRFALDVNDINQAYSSCSVTWGDVSCSADGKELRVLDLGSTVIDVPAGEAGAQQRSALFNSLCSDANSATCTFSPDSEVHTALPGKPWGKPVANTTDETHTYGLVATDTVSSTDLVEVGINVSVKMGKAVDVGITTKFQHAWTTTRTFSQSLTLTVPPHKELWVEEGVPVLRHTGLFTIALGNTTWRFHDVQWDSPDPSPEAAAGVFTIRERPWAV
ncbi:hypothetical protein ACIQWR_37815 [Streptomyces sp. NPDC098789]|uniref:hypothetical protein n=1 Tax=Streptomyces sp. NPDC098789 TaxID=3366098 RepID=UPI00380C67E7